MSRFPSAKSAKKAPKKKAKPSKPRKRSGDAAPSPMPVVTVRKRSDSSCPLVKSVRKRGASSGRVEAPPCVQEQVAERKRLMLFYLSESKGNVAYSCEKTGISRMTHYRWLRSDPAYAEMQDDIAEGVVDEMEELFIKTTIGEKDLRSMRWFLERKARDRGYGKPTVMSVDADGNPIGYGATVTNNTQINLKQDVPASSLLTALQDLAASNPALLAAIAAKQAEDGNAVGGGGNNGSEIKVLSSSEPSASKDNTRVIDVRFVDEVSDMDDDIEDELADSDVEDED